MSSSSSSHPGEKQPDVESYNRSYGEFDGNLRTTHNAHHRNDVVLVPQPSDDPDDPLNWPLWKKNLTFGIVCVCAFASQMSPNSNQLTFPEQGEVYYGVGIAAMLNTVAASLAGWTAGPLIIIPFCSLFGRTAVIFWSQCVICAAQIWAATCTGPNDYNSFLASRAVCGIFGAIPAILGSGYIIDLYFLHQRGKAFAIFEVLIIFAVVGSGTIGGFIAEYHPLNYVFWWTLGIVGASILLTLFVLEDTTYIRDPSKPQRAPPPKNYLANRVYTLLPGTATQPPGRFKAFIRSAYLPIQIMFTPIMLLVGAFIFIALGLPILNASTMATYLVPPVAAGGYGFSPTQVAYFTFAGWIGMFVAQAYGFFFNDKIPLWLARRRGGTWHPEYRLANNIQAMILLPIALGIYGSAVEYHLHYMVLALGSFLIWYSSLLALPVCYNYIVEIFLKNPVETSVALNAYRVSFGLMSVYIVTDWTAAVGVGWVWGMGAFFIVFVDLIMIGVIFRGYIVRNLTKRLNPSITDSEDGQKISVPEGLHTAK